VSPRIVGLAGPAGVGKSTAATLIAMSGDWRVISFAEPLRAAALELHPEWSILDFQGPGKERKRPPSPLGWGRMEDIVVAWAMDLTGFDVADGFPFLVQRVMSAMQESLSPRETLRVLGDFVRAMDADAFTRRGREVADRELWSGRSVVFDDVRFEPEAEMIRTAGGLVVHLTRHGVTFRRDHHSEIGLAFGDGDAALHNPGAVRGLHCELSSVLMRRLCTHDVARLAGVDQ